MPPQHSVPKPRILMAAYQIRNLSNGGMESATRIFEALRHEFEWSLMTTREMPRTQRWRDGGARVAIAPFDDLKPRWSRRLAGLGWSARLALEIVRFRPDIVHCNDIQSYQAYAFLPKRLRRAPLIFTLRDTRPPGDRPGPIWRKLAAEARSLVVLSEDMGRRFIEDVPQAKSKTVVVNSIVDLDRMRPASPAERAEASARLGVDEGDYTIACIGAVSEKKGQLELITEVWPRVAASSPNAKLHLLGDCAGEPGSYAARTIAAAEASEYADRIVVHGHVDAVADWYKVADVICIAARNEGLARAMIEGMASGIPVVSFDVSSAREMLEDTGSGIVVKAGDYNSLAEALLALKDQSARAALGDRGRNVAEARFSQERVAKSWQSLYRATVGAPV